MAGKQFGLRAEVHREEQRRRATRVFRELIIRPTLTERIRQALATYSYCAKCQKNLSHRALARAVLAVQPYPEAHSLAGLTMSLYRFLNREGELKGENLDCVWRFLESLDMDFGLGEGERSSG